MRIYLPEKVAERLRWISLNYFLKVFTEIEVNICFVVWPMLFSLIFTDV